MSIDVTRGGGNRDGCEILPTKSGDKIKVAVGVVFGVAAAGSVAS